MKTHRAIIVEDERLASERLKSLLETHQLSIDLEGIADTGHLAIQLIEAKKPDVIFLDIQLPDMTGFDVLSKLSYQPWIIFTTAYSEHALEAFKNLTIDYLVKPIEQERFDQAIKKLTLRNQSSNVDLQLIKSMFLNDVRKPSSLAIKKKDKIILIDFDEIVYVNAEDKYININTKVGDKHLMGKSLADLLDQLPEQFVRVHRSYIVNKNFVSEIHKHFKGKYILQLSDKLGSKIKTGETYNQVMKEVFGL